MKRTLALLLASAALLGTAFAQTAANEEIKNQAKARYVDSNGIAQEVDSNQVTTIVQQVYSFTITPDSNSAIEASVTTFGQTRTAMPGTPVYFVYSIKNTGNGPDTINLSNVQGSSDSFDFSVLGIYLNANCDTSLDAGERSAGTISSVALAAAETKCVIVEATIPSAATNSQTGNYNLSGVSAGSGSVTDSNNWAQATATTSATFDFNKSVSPTTAVAPGATLTYTLSGTNRGGRDAAVDVGVVTVDGTARDGLFVVDPIPTGLTYVLGSLSATAGSGGTRTLVYYDNLGTPATGDDVWTATEPTTAARVSRVGVLFGSNFVVGATFSISFGATVPSSATPASSYSNSATIYYNNNALTSPADVNQTTGTVTSTVAASYGVKVGPDGAPEAIGAADVYTVTSAYNGQTAIFLNTLKNTGNAADSYVLSLSGVPSGWSCQLKTRGGSGNISSAVALAAGASYDFQVDCAIPASATPTTTDQSFTVTATSVNASDTTTDTLSEIADGYNLDLATLGQSNDGVAGDDNAANQNTNPNTTVNFPIEVTNTGASTDSYSLSASSIPAGWDVKFYPADSSGTITSSTAVTNTSPVLSGATGYYVAVVTVPASATPGLSTLTFTSTSNSRPSDTSDSMNAPVTVNLVTGFTFTLGQSKTMTSPGVAVFSHTLSNTGNAAATVSLPAITGGAGFTYEYATSASGPWTSTLSGISLAAGATAPVYVRVQSVAGIAVNTQDSVSITATATYTGGTTATSTLTDQVRIVDGSLTLVKEWTNSNQPVSGTAVWYKGDGSDSTTPPQVAPGGYITYRIVATNISTEDLKRIRISDPLPGFTNFVSVSVSTSITGTVVYSTDGTTWTATAPTSIASGGNLWVAVNTVGAAVSGVYTIDDADLMVPGATITILFTVQVQ